MKHRFSAVLGMAFCYMTISHALNLKTDREEFDRFVQQMTDDFDSFRRKSLTQFAEFVRNPWKEFSETKPLPKPEPKPIAPVVMNDDDKDEPVKDKPVVIDEVVTPFKDEPQPEPVEPIEEVPAVNPEYVGFTFFGTDGKVRCDSGSLPKLSGLSESEISGMLQQLAIEDYDNMIRDCLKIRQGRNLSDWAYLQMLSRLVEKLYPSSPNEAQLMLAYLYMQSGYRTRLGTDGTHLYMLYASKHMIYEKPSYSVDGFNYYGLRELPGRMRICQAAFPKEKSMSLLVNKNQLFSLEMTPEREIKSSAYPESRFRVSVNKNLLDFYSTYPTSALDGNVMTRWAMYANTPMDDNVSDRLYPDLKRILEGKSEYDATNILLNTIQTGMAYEYDSKVWGGDRAFFPEETLYYPYCDCEDRAILLTRLVRDLLGLKCLLVYYPGHLAAAIEYTGDVVTGDYISLDGRKYVIADPTYINAPIGRTMPGMDNASAKVILLDSLIPKQD